MVIDGVLQGEENKVAADYIEIAELSGSGQEVVSSGAARSDETAISIGTLTATDSTVLVDDNKGSIAIDTMAASTEVGTTGNSITALQGNVIIGKLDGANAKTSITTGRDYSITVTGKDDSLNTASNQNWKSGSLDIEAAGGLELTDSTVNVDEVTGTSLSLKGASSLTTDDVELDSLSIADTSWVDADNVTVDDLTLDGTKATLKGSPNLTVKDELTLKNGAALDGVKADTAALVLENSSLDLDEITGITGLTLKGSTATIDKGLTGLTEDVVAEVLNDERSSLTTDVLGTDGQVLADASTIRTTQGGISAGNGVTATNGGSITSAQGITSGAGVTAEGGSTITTQGAITAAETVKADNGIINTNGNAIEAESMTISNGGSITAGAVTLDGALNAAGGKLTAASVSGATDVALKDAAIAGELSMSGKLDMTGGQAASVTGAAGAELDGATITGELNASGEIEADDATIGSITGSATSVELSGTKVGDITMATTGDLTVTGGSTGAVNAGAGNTVASATLTNTSIGSGLNVTGDMSSTGAVEVKGDVTVGGNLAVNTGTLTAEDVTVAGTTTLMGGEVKADSFHSTEVVLKDIEGDIDELLADKGLSMDGAEVTVGSVQVDDGDMTLTGGAKVTNGGAAGIGGELTVSGSVFTNQGAVEAEGLTTVDKGGKLTGASLSTNGLTVEDKDAAGNSSNVTIAGDIDLNNGGLTVADGSIVQAGGDITGAGAVSLDNGATVSAKGGDLTGATTVTVAGGSTLNADVAASGDVTLTDAAKITGSVTTEGAVTVTDGTIGGDVSTTGDAALDGATIKGALAAADTTVTGAATVGSADVAGLTVTSGASLTAAGSVTTAGDLDIAGEVTSTAGDITLTGDGTVSADVTAKNGTLDINGNLSAAEVVLTGKSVNIDGTLNAGKGLSLAGTVTGTGAIVKTGGDTLALAGDTKIGGVTVNGSKLEAGDGANLGKLNLVGSTLEIAGAGAMGSVVVDGGSIDAASTVVADVKLGQRSGVDAIINKGAMSIDGAVVKLNDLGTNEANVADQQRIALVDGKVSGSFAADVQHSYDTLNVHAEGGEIVFSRNYKGARNMTENQVAASDALAALTAPTGELAGVVDALNHTRTEADALKALDSLGGAGLTAAPKLVTDETKEHLQTLRSTLQSVAAGLERRYSATGMRLSDVESTSVSASVTGGSSTVNANDNAEEYKRSSLGAMLTVAHAINEEWTFGGALSFSQADADCGSTTVDSQGIFLDVGVMQKRGRFSQMGSIGCAFFSMDTEREVAVNAPGHAFAGTAEGSTDAAAFTMTYETSYAIWQTESYSLSSVIMAEALFAQVSDMEEEGMGNAGLRSSFDDVAAFTFGVGGRYTYHFGEEYNPGYFAMEAMFVADTGDSVTKVNNAFIGGGNSFQMSGPDAGNYGLRLNAGLLLPIGEQWGLFGNVTGEIRTEQTTVGGSVGVKYAF